MTGTSLWLTTRSSLHSSTPLAEPGLGRLVPVAGCAEYGLRLDLDTVNSLEDLI